MSTLNQALNPVRAHALVPCAGHGARAGAPLPKQYVQLDGIAIVERALLALFQTSSIESFHVVLASDDSMYESHVSATTRARVSAYRVGGDTRAASVLAGLRAMRERGVSGDDWVLVHDAARCLVAPQAVERLIQACRDDAVGGLLALPVADTLKRSDEQDRIGATVDRVRMWAAQTPQMFRLGVLIDAIEGAHRVSAPHGHPSPPMTITDEASAMEALGLRPKLIRGDVMNIKLTWPEDFDLAQRWLRARPSS